MELSTILSIVRTLISGIPAGRKLLRMFSGGLSIESIEPLLSPDDDAIGLKVLLKNTSQSNHIFKSIELAGFIRFSVQGFMPQIERQSFHVDLDATDQPNVFEGSLRTNPNDEWFLRCAGRIEHACNTGMGDEWWRYSLLCPITSQIPAGGLAEYRLAFRRKTKRLVSMEGGILAMTRSLCVEGRHEIRLVRDNGKKLVSSMSPDFAAFVINWNPTDTPSEEPQQLTQADDSASCSPTA